MESIASYGASIRQARMAQYISLRKLAETIGVDISYLSKIERGETKPSLLLEAKLEAALRQLPLLLTDSTSDETADLGGEASANAQTALSPRNMLNNLAGREWIQETKSVWRQKGLGANHPETAFEKLHPAPFSFQDVARLIRFFTKPGMLVCDPFVGVGSTLKAAALEGRRGLGIELSPKWAELAKRRLLEEVPTAEGQRVWCMDVRDATKQLDDDSLDFIVTSPPYWGILNKRADHKTKSIREAKGLATNYSADDHDLGNIQEYDRFLEELTAIFIDLVPKLKPGRYCSIIVSDFKHGSRFYPFHSDLYSRLVSNKLELHGITVLEQTHKSLYPYGYPFAYVPNIHHQYILIFRRPGMVAQRSKRPAEVNKADVIIKAIERARVPTDLGAAIERFRRLPYRKGDMAGRHWGHQRHSICSFPSKMKPALAATLVELFTTPASVVLDPFSGSGTIPFEAALHGRTSIGSDLSPLAHTVTSAKIVPPANDEVEVILLDLESHLLRHADAADLNEMEPEIKSFYHPQSAKEIVTARNYLLVKLHEIAQEPAVLFVSACLAHILHGNRPYALSRRSHNIIPIPPKGPVEYKPLIASLRDKCHRMLAFPLPPTFVNGRSFLAAASNLPLPEASVDVVVTSPPFLGTTQFLRQNRIRNWFAGWDYQTQAERGNLFLEEQRGVAMYAPILEELHRVLRPGGLVAFHVGIVKTVSMADLLAPLFAQAGFREIDRVWEPTSNLETHGRSDRGGTHTHGFMFLTRV